jgi:serine/threonine protein kinase
MNHLHAGYRVGAFILEERIGSGGFASVWRAHHVAANVAVAVKVIPKESIATPLARTRLTREITILRRLGHPFIAQLFEISQDADCHYLAMEYVENGNFLNHVNSNGRLSEDQARRYFSQLLWALDYLHTEHHVAHRDVKCENILLDRHLNIRVIDFGLSAQFTDVNPRLLTACGSPAYAAPEMVKGKPYTKAADIWSAGVLLFAIVAGYLLLMTRTSSASCIRSSLPRSPTRRSCLPPSSISSRR